MKTEPKYFNCSEEHELDYVAGLYKKKSDVKAWLKDKCEDRTICYTTHADIYKMLADEGYERK